MCTCHYIAIVLGLLALYVLITQLMRAHYRVPYEGATRHLITTPDGHTQKLFERRAATKRFKEPVILCHGLGANRYNLDFPGHSLAAVLNEAGFDTYIVELRGAGEAPSPRIFGRPSWRFDFDDLVNHDVTSLIKTVQELSGEKEALWVGHSMGGMLAYAYLGTGGTGLKAATAIASPSAFDALPDAKAFARLVKLAGWLPYFPQPFFVSLFFPIGTGRFMPFFLRNLTPPGTISTPLDYKLLANMFDLVSLSLAKQFGDWLVSGHFRSRDGRVNYLDALAEVRIPFALLAGADDKLAPPSSVEAAYHKLGSAEKSYHLFGRAQGADHDYGHGDIIFSESARREIFPLVRDFLAKHATAIREGA